MIFELTFLCCGFKSCFLLHFSSFFFVFFLFFQVLDFHETSDAGNRLVAALSLVDILSLFLFCFNGFFVSAVVNTEREFS